ncbi:MAG: hypothetical protein US50_C0020G0006 [Candidatus Nomurabacteria bacterium GW2011_GWB1_37_5]|uniref:Uncharacterized protein n=1 Tax=Candidatus Nomurabacteria bacterium GW2011_GWB1_37_5 TaxID=1618742 RepID=A0A0G0GZ19_9BACT|nr:MAG: hypothetical protein US50_C0020G0006 [Candidatus Nomurabacteria bacterium GW2011_GWB1_37_5]
MISIATSVAAVSLLQVAPVEIVQPINKVVKETIEKVVTIKGKTLSPEETELLQKLKELQPLLEGLNKKSDAVEVIDANTGETTNAETGPGTETGSVDSADADAAASDDSNATSTPESNQTGSGENPANTPENDPNLTN